MDVVTTAYISEDENSLRSYLQFFSDSTLLGINSTNKD